MCAQAPAKTLVFSVVLALGSSKLAPEPCSHRCRWHLLCGWKEVKSALKVFLSHPVYVMVSVKCHFAFSRDGKALERFLQDYFDGNLKKYLKSEPVPENNDGPVKVSVVSGEVKAAASG